MGLGFMILILYAPQMRHFQESRKETLVGRYTHNGKASQEAYHKKRRIEAEPARDE